MKHLYNDVLMMRLTQLDPKFKKYIIKILRSLMTNTSISSDILNEIVFIFKNKGIANSTHKCYIEFRAIEIL